MLKKTLPPELELARALIRFADLGRILDEIPVRVYLKDAERHFTYFNRATAEALRMDEPVGAIGRADEDIFTPDHADEARRDEEAILAGGPPIIDKEELETWRDGRRSWVLTSKLPLRDASGNITGIVGISKDITHTKKQLEQYSLAVEGARDGLWHRQLTNGEVWFSARWKEILGYKDHEVPNELDEFDKRVHADDKDRVESARKRHFAEETPTYECEFRMQNKDGNYRWIRARGKVTRDSDGNPVAFAGSHTDITEAKNLEEFHLHVLDTITSFIFVKDNKGKFTFCNQALADAFNLTKQQIMGKTDADLNPEKDQVEHFQADDRKVLEIRKPLDIKEELFTDAMGNTRILATKKVPLQSRTGLPGEPIKVLGVATDISALHRAREQVERERELLHNLMDNVPDAIFFKDKECRYTRANAALARLVGAKSPDDLVGKRDCDIDFFKKETADESLAIEQRILETGRSELNRIHHTLTEQGVRWRLVNKVPIKNEQGEVSQIVGIVRDITDLKETEENLRAQTELLEQIFDVLPQCIWVKDRNSKYIKCNKSFARRRGYKEPKDVEGKTDYDHWPKEEAEQYICVDQEVMNSDEPKICFREHQRMPDGNLAVLETSKIPLHDADGNVTNLLCIYEDITERLEVEKQKLKESVDRDIVRSISHCLKNWITLLETVSFGLKLKFGDDPAIRRLNRAIEFLKHATQVATAINALHATKSYEELSINEILESIVELAGDDRIHLVRCADNLRILGCRGHLQNALMELLANARDFTPTAEEGGRIDVWSEVREGTYTINFRNNGPGVPQHLKGERLFRPFETSESARTGMGLGYVRAVVQAHSGSIKEIGEEAEGAHFVIDLPIKEK